MRLINADDLNTHKFLTPQVKVIGGRRNGKIREQIVEAYQKGWNDCIDAIIDNAPTVEPQMTELEEHFYHRCGFLQGIEYGKELTRPQGEWIDHSEDYGYVECPICGHLTSCCGDKDELHYCWSCGAEMRKGDNNDT